ncbi:MAG TPA: hypothetical protein VLM89_00210 [Phycisphaerae bacterium]|nr:hypothetical protein [Phycisphaerae bacterium]
MSIPDVDIPVTSVRVPLEWIMRAEQAPKKAEERMLRTARALEDASVPYVIIGGNAVAIWVASRDEGAVRNTKDVDIMLNRQDLDRAAKAMSDAGFDMTEVNGVTVFLDRQDPMPSRGVYVIFANEKLRSHDPLPTPPVVTGIRSPKGADALNLRELLILKLMAFRRIDQVHILDLLHVGLIDEAMAAQIPVDLRPRLEELLADPDG